MPEKSDLSPEQQIIFEDVTTGESKNIFITGGAGTGKSHLLKALRLHYEIKYNDQCVVLAPTGIAALNIDGKTIHSY